MYLQAAQWLDRLSDGPLDNITKKRFTNWLAANEQHQVTFDTMANTWQDVSMDEAIQTAKKSRTWREKILQGFTPPILLGGVTLAIVVLMVVLFIPPHVSPFTPVTQSFTTTIAEQKDFLLDDGSRLEMSSDTAIYIHFSAAKRGVNLKKGASYFAVASDKKRPFEVSMGNASVTAVGTEFNIDHSVHGSDVTVYEGAVEVRTKDNGVPTLLRAGETIHIDQNGLSVIEAVDLAQIVDWRTGWIEITHKPLSYLIERLNRESKMAITIASPAIADLPIAGRFRLRDSQQTLAMLSEVYGLTITHEKQQIIVSTQRL